MPMKINVPKLGTLKLYHINRPIDMVVAAHNGDEAMAIWYTHAPIPKRWHKYLSKPWPTEIKPSTALRLAGPDYDETTWLENPHTTGSMGYHNAKIIIEDALASNEPTFIGSSLILNND